MINDYKAQEEWKIQLTMSINFISSKNFDEARNLPTKTNNIEAMIDNEADEIIEEIFEYLLQSYQKDLKETMRRGSNFIFDSVGLLCYYLQKSKLKKSWIIYRFS